MKSIYVTITTVVGIAGFFFGLLVNNAYVEVVEGRINTRWMQKCVNHNAAVWARGESTAIIIWNDDHTIEEGTK